MIAYAIKIISSIANIIVVSAFNHICRPHVFLNIMIAYAIRIISSILLKKLLLNCCLFIDLIEARPSHSAPCSSEELCQKAHSQNLAGCDAASGQCVCQRGYRMDSDVCVGRRMFC